MVSCGQQSDGSGTSRRGLASFQELLVQARRRSGQTTLSSSRTRLACWSIKQTLHNLAAGIDPAALQRYPLLGTSATADGARGSRFRIASSKKPVVRSLHVENKPSTLPVPHSPQQGDHLKQVEPERLPGLAAVRQCAIRGELLAVLPNQVRAVPYPTAGLFTTAGLLTCNTMQFACNSVRLICTSTHFVGNPMHALAYSAVACVVE